MNHTRGMAQTAIIKASMEMAFFKKASDTEINFSLTLEYQQQTATVPFMSRLKKT